MMKFYSPQFFTTISVLLATFASSQAATLPNAEITEFLADNAGGLEDEDGSSTDWIEIWNTSGVAGDLGGWYLTDDATTLTKWTIPAVELAVDEYLVVFASGKDRTDPSGELHTNFSIKKDAGGYLALVKPDGVTIASVFGNYPEQLENISYGVGFFPEPTPGAINGISYDGITADTKFSVDRGLHDTAFDLVISTATTGAEIRYTTDGTPPGEATGTVYSAPISISSTTVVRAAAFRDGFAPTNVDTHSYIFPADVVTQPTMSTAITQSATYGPLMVPALESVPTIALSFDGDDIDRDEIAVSVELLNFESQNKQVDAGAARFGSFVTDFEKRSFRLHFRSLYGPSRLAYPLFDNVDFPIAPTDTFDSLDIRAGNHDMIDRGAYLSNRFTDDAMLEMGNISAHGRFVHVYFNGLYHGHYHLRERWDAAMAADYLPGKEEEFDTINANNSGRQFGLPNLQELQDGDLDDWIVLRNLIDNSPTPYSATKDMLDVANLIDFMLLWTMGDSESEFRAAGSVENGVGFKFFIKDADGFLRAPNDSHHNVDHNGPLNAMTAFRNEGDPDFMTLLADRIHLHFFNGGALTPERNIARLQLRVDEMSLSYIAEAARRSQIISPTRTSTNRTPPQWLAYQENIINNRFPTLSEARLNKLRAANMYPDIIAPVLSQHGGSIPPGAGITMRTDAPKIYYTLDGSDPRLPGGAINPAATDAPLDPEIPMPEDFVDTGAVWKYLDDGTDLGTTWIAVSFDDGAWESGPSPLGYGEPEIITQLNTADTDPDQAGLQRLASNYLRHTVEIPNPGKFSYFEMSFQRDDGVAIYVNGTEVARLGLDPGAAYNDFANDSRAGAEEDAYETVIVPTSAFVSGTNTIAAEIHNASAGSSDLRFDLRLKGDIDVSGGGNLTLPVTLAEAASFKARAFIPATGEWSALTTTFFSINSVPASAENLVISEIHYHPAEPVAAAELAVSTDRDDYEFIELLNIGAQPVDLTGVNFAAGITFSFLENTLLDPGSRVVLVRDAQAFAVRYPAVQMDGVYSGRLSNGGETLQLNLAGVGQLRSLTYDDSAPWPTAPDGRSASLVLVNPTSNPNHALPTSWAASATSGGNPGEVGIPVMLASWKLANGVSDENADDDHDGLSALLEYVFGTSPSIANPEAMPVPGTVQIGGDLFSTITYQRNTDARDFTIQLQSSADLKGWQDEEEIEVTPGTYRITTPVAAGQARQFLRLKVTID